MTEPQSGPFVDADGVPWESEVAYYGVGLKLACPNGEYVSVLTGLGSQGMTYQVLPNAHPPLPWPPYPDSIEYGERCRCDECAGRLVGDTVAAILAEADEIQGTMKVNLDTYPLRFLESARDLVVREVQLAGYGIHHEPDTMTDTYVSPARRVIVRYSPSLEEVESVGIWMPAADPGTPLETYPQTVAGAVAAVRGPGA